MTSAGRTPRGGAVAGTPRRRRPWPRPGSFEAANLVVLAAALAAWVALRHLQLDVDGRSPGAGGLRLAREFFGAALQPALSPAADAAAAPGSLLPQVARAAGMTVAVAAAALSLAVAGGLLLGFGAAAAPLAGRPGRVLAVSCRAIALAARSVHELVWAVLLLAAFGRDELVAAIAIALPYAGVLGRLFSELLDEAPPEASAALSAAGAAPWQAFLAARLPQAAPDMLAYVFYRFECALRSSAVLGFFGFPTLGYHIAASFENLHYGEVWTYLYALAALVLAVDWWSGRLRAEAQR